MTVRNVITSMRLVSMINWAEFFESVSPVDAVLRGASDFAAMDFPTRDRYRRAIEELARESGRDEVDVTKHAIAAARRATDQTAEKDSARGRESDPGYYLIAKGRRAFERELGCRVPFRTRLFQLQFRSGRDELYGHDRGGHRDHSRAHTHRRRICWESPAGRFLSLAIVGLVPASDVAIAIVNRAITQQVGGKDSARIGIARRRHAGSAHDHRHAGLLASASAIEKQIERLEDHHLSNPDDNFTFRADLRLAGLRDGARLRRR